MEKKKCDRRNKGLLVIIYIYIVINSARNPTTIVPAGS